MARPQIDRKKEELTSALSTFEGALALDLRNKSELEIDVMKNGQIQNFEYTLELCWKLLQELYKEKGLLLNYPKEVFRERFTVTSLTEDEKSLALTMIDDRNRIAHEYKDYIMDVMWPKLPLYLSLLKRLSDL